MTENLSPVTSRTSAVRSLAALLVIAGALFFVGLGRLPLLEPDEGRNAEIAREMLVSHDWITPHYDTFTNLDKPPVLFWMVAGAFRAFGISGWPARFPSAVLGLATVVLAWLMARRMLGAKTSLYAGIILATSPLAFALARFVIFDMPLTFFVSLAMYCCWLSSRRGFSRALDAGAGAAMGIATLIKGPVGFVLPLLTLAAYQALIGKFRSLKKAHWGAGAAAFFAVTLPWLIAVSLHHPSFPKYALWTQSLVRFATGDGMHRYGGPWYYIPVYFGAFFPWSFFLLLAACSRLKKWRSLWQESHRGELFLLTWAAVVFVFFSFSHSQLPEYFLPALVPLSLLMASLWQKATRDPAGRAPGWVKGGYGLMILVGLLMAATRIIPLHDLESHLARRLPVTFISTLQPSLFSGGIILAALGFLGRNMASRWLRPRIRRFAFAVVALTLPLCALRWLGPIRNYFEVFSSREIARAILNSPERNDAVYGYYYFRTSLPFYLRRPVGLVTSSGTELTSNYVINHLQQDRAQTFPAHVARRDGVQPGNLDQTIRSWGQEPLLINSKELKKLAESPPGPFLLLVQNNEVGTLIGVVGSVRPLWEGWNYSVWEKGDERRETRGKRGTKPRGSRRS